MNIDLIPNGAIKIVHVSQNDVGRTLTFELFNNSTSYTVPSGAVVKIQGTKPSGFGFSEVCSVSGNVATIDTTEAMTDESGNIQTELSISYDDVVIGTSNFVLAVEKNPHPSNTTDGTQITAQSLQVQINELAEIIESGGSGLTDGAKQALLNCFAHVAWIDEHGQDYYDALEDALYPPVTAISISPTTLTLSAIGATSQLTATTTPSGGNVTWTSSNTSVATVSSSGLVTSVGYGSCTITATSGSVSASCSVAIIEATVTSITATYTQSGTVYDTDSLDDLKADLVVTANYDNGTTQTVSDYTLSGTLSVGASTITVTYGGKTSTFSVTVSKAPSYVTENLELWLDARQNVSAYSQIADQSGNNVPLTLGQGTYANFFEKYISVYRGQIKAEDSTFMSKLANGWTVEAIWQNRYYDANSAITDVTPASGSYSRIASAVNGRALIFNNTQMQALDANTIYGTATSVVDRIMHVSITYDGTTLKEYIEGELAHSETLSIGLSSASFIEFLGNMTYSSQTSAAWNAFRVYSKVLTASEIKDNYDFDIINYGTVNIEATA